MADTELLPCPFCGGDAQTDFIEGESYLIECYACRAETGIKDSEEDAIAAWNRRAALASRPAEVDDRTPRPMSTAPHDGTEVLAWSITGKTWHQVYWKTQENGDWLFLDPFPARWACRWNSDYYQGQNEFSHWLPIPGAPSHTTNKET